jgi:hypothetical protein
MRKVKQTAAAVKLAQPTDTMPYCIKLQISAKDYHALVEHFATPAHLRMGKPLVAVNEVYSAYGWEANLKACAAQRAAARGNGGNGGTPIAGQQGKQSVITFANHGGREQAGLFHSKDGKHRINVRKAGSSEVISIARCTIILNPDNR